MRSIVIILFLIVHSVTHAQQPSGKPCAEAEVYRQFDFWIGEWDVYGKNGKKGGDSKIQLILDSCVILENWTNVSGTYSGKSFNTYNSKTRQWQQTWVDNMGGSTEYLQGKSEDNKITFLTEPFWFSKDSMAIRKLTFYKISKDKVRQHGEISKDDGKTWVTEYDLEYRRKKS